MVFYVAFNNHNFNIMRITFTFGDIFFLANNCICLVIYLFQPFFSVAWQLFYLPAD